MGQDRTPENRPPALNSTSAVDLAVQVVPVQQ